MSCTRDCTCFRNSWSTRARSSRTGSKIWAKSKGDCDLCTSLTRVNLTTATAGCQFVCGRAHGAALALLRPEQRVEVGGGLLDDCRWRRPARRGEGFGHVDDEGGLVPLAAVRHRREVRTVG